MCYRTRAITHLRSDGRIENNHEMTISKENPKGKRRKYYSCNILTTMNLKELETKWLEASA
jgi:hypothetical protein